MKQAFLFFPNLVKTSQCFTQCNDAIPPLATQAQPAPPDLHSLHLYCYWASVPLNEPLPIQYLVKFHGHIFTYSPPSMRRQHSFHTIWLYWNALHIRKVLLLKQFCGQDQSAEVSVWWWWSMNKLAHNSHPPEVSVQSMMTASDTRLSRYQVAH